MLSNTNTQNARWPGGVVPYTIANSFNTKERGVIAKAMREYKKNTCIRGSTGSSGYMVHVCPG